MDVQMLIFISFGFHFLSMILCTNIKVLFGTKFHIKELDVDTGNVKLLVTNPEIMFAMDYDDKNKHIYFTQYDHRKIMQFPYPAQNAVIEKFVNTGSGPAGIAIDSENGHVYWTEYQSNRLMRCSVARNNEVHITTLTSPFSVRIDVLNRWLYVAERFARIIKARFNYSEAHGIVDLKTRVDYMDLDRNEDKLYWTTFHYPGNLKSASVRGCDVKTLYTTGHTDQFCPIGVYGGAIFYTSNKNLLMLNKTERHSPTSVYTDSNNIYSIYVYHQRGNIFF
ncbi:low-density lipoprotein receptor-related protein 8-like isoform X2 [Mytilus edulis]|uniref:low-density lipoprotein receptor-related protein 8-like isoform X2 n=1 Tax=Mytilus edulis TaxID=6550 RepID=UPI0039F0A9EA